MARLTSVLDGFVGSLILVPFAAVVLFLGWLLGHERDDVRTGTMHVTTCERHDDPHFLPVRCVGTFVSDDGTLRVAATAYRDEPQWEMITGWFDAGKGLMLTGEPGLLPPGAFLVFRTVAVGILALPIAVGLRNAVIPPPR